MWPQPGSTRGSAIVSAHTGHAIRSRAAIWLGARPARRPVCGSVRTRARSRRLRIPRHAGHQPFGLVSLVGPSDRGWSARIGSSRVCSAALFRRCAGGGSAGGRGHRQARLPAAAPALPMGHSGAWHVDLLVTTVLSVRRQARSLDNYLQGGLPSSRWCDFGSLETLPGVFKNITTFTYADMPDRSTSIHAAQLFLIADRSSRQIQKCTFDNDCPNPRPSFRTTHF